VFMSRNATPLDARNVRRSFTRICESAKIGGKWAPHELRHSFVSIMSDSGVPIERIADLVGHAGGSRVTEQIYRQQTRPVLVDGATVMNEIFGTATRPRRVVRKARRAAANE
jgi:site-specific recombinase XerD